MSGLVAYGVYLPYYRLERQAIAKALGVPAGKGTRAVASYDEDTTSMGAEAARAALDTLPAGLAPAALYFATADPAYLDKTNATAVHAACALSPSALAVDMAGAVRSGIGALKAAADASTPTVAVLSDTRNGLPGGGDEAGGGDAAAAFVFAEGPAVAELIGSASATEEFLERWRMPGDKASKRWEERFGETVYMPLGEQAFTEALKASGLTVDQVDYLVVTGVHDRAAAKLRKSLGVKPEAVVDDLASVIGQTGTAHPGVALASILDRATPNQIIVIVSLADGSDALVFRTAAGISDYQPKTTVQQQIDAGSTALDYSRFLTWRGHLERQPPRRPDPSAPAAPPSLRSEGWKFRFEGSRCEVCGTRHLPPARVCVNCKAVDRMTPERLVDVPATVATYTIDHLAFTPNPPIVAAVCDFDGGGRFMCELTDVDPSTVNIGDRVEMTFRRVTTAEGVHNYFWKARPMRESA